MTQDHDFGLFRYDQGREDGAVIDDWEDPKLEIYHTQDRYLVLLLSNRLTFAYFILLNSYRMTWG